MGKQGLKERRKFVRNVKLNSTRCQGTIRFLKTSFYFIISSLPIVRVVFARFLIRDY